MKFWNREKQREERQKRGSREKTLLVLVATLRVSGTKGGKGCVGNKQWKMGYMAVTYWTSCWFTLLYRTSVQTGCIFLSANHGWTWHSIKGCLGLRYPWKEQQCPPISPNSSLVLAPGSRLLFAGWAVRAHACWSQPRRIIRYERPWAEGKARLLLWPQHSLILAKDNCKTSFF